MMKKNLKENEKDKEKEENNVKIKEKSIIQPAKKI